MLKFKTYIVDMKTMVYDVRYPYENCKRIKNEQDNVPRICHVHDAHVLLRKFFSTNTSSL